MVTVNPPEIVRFVVVTEAPPETIAGPATVIPLFTVTVPAPTALSDVAVIVPPSRITWVPDALVKVRLPAVTPFVVSTVTLALLLKSALFELTNATLAPVTLFCQLAADALVLQMLLAAPLQ